MGKLITFVAGVVILAIGLMFSLVIFATAAIVGLIAMGVFWWRTRALRKQMRERSSEGEVVEGQVIEKVYEIETHDQERDSR